MRSLSALPPIAVDVSAAVAPDVSGVGYHIINLVGAMRRIDAELPLRLLFQSDGADTVARARRLLEPDGRVRLCPVPFPRRPGGLAWPLYWALRLPLAAHLGGARLFHGPAHIIPRWFAGPQVVTIHDLAFFRHDLYAPAVNAALRQHVAGSVRRARAVIALSEHTARDIGDLLGRTDGVHVIHGAGNYAGPEGRDPQPRDREVLDRFGIAGPYVFYVGDFGARKNLPYLLESFAALTVRRTTGASERLQLVLAGNSTDASADLRSRAALLGIGERVVLTGRVGDETLACLYRHASAFALCSLMEGFTLVTLEAMSYGVPVVATNTSSIAEGTGNAAELVPLDSAAVVATALARALTPGQRRDEMIRLGFERVSRFSWERAARETLAVYASVHRGGRGVL